MPRLTDIFAYLIALGLLLWIRHRGKKRSQLPLPPGPKKLPLIGNLLDLPTHHEWLTYARWSRELNSDIIHLSAAGVSVVVINSSKVASELLDKRSAIYSSRPHLVMVHDLMGWGRAIAAMPYGSPWRERRRLFQQQFHPSDLSFTPVQVKFVRKLLPQLLDTPEGFMDSIRHMVGGMTLTLAYGIDIRHSNDPYIALAEKANKTLGEAAMPGAFLVDTFPILKYVPEFFPGAGFKKKAREWRAIATEFWEAPFAEVQRQMANGAASRSFTSFCLDSLHEFEDPKHQQEIIRDTAGMFFLGGADTTVSAIHTFIIAMLCYPEVQAKAQQELDRVVGPDRLPELADEHALPYLSALLKEVLRWQPVAPLAIPHFLIREDVYSGYRIPQNSVVFGNVWAILHDEKEYPDPSTFKPERFLKVDGQSSMPLDPTTVAFGFGRRVCPGGHIAMSLLFLTASAILSTFDISKAVDENGSPCEPSMEYTSTIASLPLPFKCNFIPRSGSAQELIRSATNLDAS